MHGKYPRNDRNMTEMMESVIVMQSEDIALEGLIRGAHSICPRWQRYSYCRDNLSFKLYLGVFVCVFITIVVVVLVAIH